MSRKVTTHLMFEGAAEEAMTLYTSLFGNSAITQIERYRPGEQGKEGTVKLASFTLAGREHLCIDSPVKHGFGFTPAMSLFVECESETVFPTDGSVADIEELLPLPFFFAKVIPRPAERPRLKSSLSRTTESPPGNCCRPPKDAPLEKRTRNAPSAPETWSG